MSQIYNEQPVLGIRLVTDGTTMYLGKPAIGIRDVGATLFTTNLRALGVSPLVADQTLYNDQQVVGAVLITDARTLYNNQLVVPVASASGALPLPPAPTVSFNFLSGETLDSRITASGGANGTRINSTGVIVAGTAPRFDYDPTSRAARGVLVEEARTNLLLNSLLSGANLTTQGVTVTAVPHTLTFYGTGTVTLSGAFAQAVVGTAAYPSRRTITFTPTAGTLTLTVTGTVQFAQLEVGSFASSFIPTAGAAVTRSADLLEMTGTNFSSWFNAAAGTFAVKVDTNNNAVFGTTFEASLIDYQNRIYGYNNGGALANGVNTANVQQAFLQHGAITIDTPFGNALAYAANDVAASMNGATALTDTSVTLPAVNQLRLGLNTGGDLSLNGHVRSFSYWNTRLSNGQLQVASAV